MLALYDPETVRNGGQTSYSRLKTSVRLFYDQKMRSRNLKARNDMIHGGVHGVERKIEPTLKGKWEIAGSGKQLDNVLKETRVVSIMELELLVTGANFLNKKSGRPRLHQIRRRPKTERENHLTKRMANLLTTGIKSHVNGEIVPIRRVVTGILPSVRTTFHK